MNKYSSRKTKPLLLEATVGRQIVGLFCAESALGSFSCSCMKYVGFFFQSWLEQCVLLKSFGCHVGKPALLSAVDRVNGQLEFGALAEMVRFLFALCDFIFFHRGSDSDSQRNALQWQWLQLPFRMYLKRSSICSLLATETQLAI